MNKFLLVLSLLAGHASASTINANSFEARVVPGLCTNENSASFPSLGSGGNATVLGSLTFNTTPSPLPNGANYCVSGWSSSNYLSETSAVTTEFSNLSTFGVEIWVYATSYSSQPIAWEYNDTQAGWGLTYMQINNTNHPQLHVAGGTIASSISITTSAWHDIVIQSISGTYNIYVDGVKGTSDPTGYTTHTVNRFQWGYSVGNSCCAWPGYLTQFRILKASSGFPTTDTISCAGSPTNTPTNTPSFTVSPTNTPSPTISATYTISPTFTYTPTAGPSPTFQITPAGKSAGVANTPPRGWVAVGILAGAGYQYISQQAEALVSQGFLAAYTAGGNGFELDLDSGWSSTTRTAGGAIQPNSLFPSMPGTLSYVASLGFVPGLYSDTWLTQCATFANQGSYGNEIADMSTMLSWFPSGAGEIKVDSCGGVNTNSQYSYTLFSNGIHAAAPSKPVDFYLCQSAQTPYNTWTWASPLGQMWNIDADIQDDVVTVMNRFQKAVALSAYSGPGGWNYPGELMIGLGGETNVQYEKQMKEWCALPAPLIIEAIIYNGSSFMDATTQAILKNSEALGLQANWNGSSLTQIQNDYAGHVIYYRPITPAGNALVLMANDTYTAQTMTVNLASVPGMGSGATIRDAWTHTNMGNFTGTYSQYTSATSAVLLVMAPGPGASPTVTPSPSGTPSFTPSPTVTQTATPIPTSCSVVGIQTPIGNWSDGQGFVFYKQITVGYSTTGSVQTVSAYLESGYGAMQAAIYTNYQGRPWQLVQASNLVYGFSPGWNVITFPAYSLTPGTYWMAVETTNTGMIQYDTAGSDYYGYQAFGDWPSQAITTNILGTADVQGFVCGY